MILSAFTKENLLAEMEHSGTFTLNYRLMFSGQPTYVSMKATRMADKNDPHLVIGVSNVDAQMKRERELNIAREKANRDALTGVKSKHAYVEAVGALNAEIGGGRAAPFAVAVCDVNGLKAVNDTQGHHAGDKLILDTAHMICETFKHSPVYRVGGDEFVVILHRQDYENRETLMGEMARRNRRNRAEGGAVIACGYATWAPGTDDRFEAVFDRADTAMYDNKTALKAGR